MRQLPHFLLAAILALFTWLAVPAYAYSEPDQTFVIPVVTLDQLPPQAKETLGLIKKGGPYCNRKDGSVFSNREHRLPPHSRGYYHEYTVPTPGARTRGARRIIGGQGGEYYYTDDHYRTFRSIRE
jgi:ribonuclease T1